jgi:hypothetical protein
VEGHILSRTAGVFLINYNGFWQNVAAGFSRRWHRLGSLCHRGFLKKLGKIFSLEKNFARSSEKADMAEGEPGLANRCP